MKPISALVESQIPRFIRMEYPNFVNFIQSYYEWSEKVGRPYEFIANIPDYMDIDRTSLDLLEHFSSIFLEPLPDVIYEKNNLRTLVKYIVQHYSAKGTEDSYKFLFRLIEGKEVDFYYPSSDMLRVSDGKWTSYKSFKIVDPPEDVLDWESSEILGRESEARAIIDFIKLYETTDGTKVAELFLVEVDIIKGIQLFQAGEDFSGSTYQGIYFEGVIASTFAGIDIEESGKYYYDGGRVIINSVNGSDASAIVDYVSKGSVQSITIVDGGLDYSLNDQLILNSSCFGTGAYGRVTEVDVSGTITAVQLVFGGHDYSTIPSVAVTSKNGSGAVLMSESDSIGKITSTHIRNFGINYEEVDTITTPLMIRIHSQFLPYEIGEIVDTVSGTGVILSHDTVCQVMAIQLLYGNILPNETLIGRRYTGTSKVYDTSNASLKYSHGGVNNYKGIFINNDGKISSDKYIQDSYFFQVFSYLIKTFQPRDEWFDYVKSVHPSGTISFGYREIPNGLKIVEDYGGFHGPTLDMTELYKHKWVDTNINTLIGQYSDVVIDDVSNINTNNRDKTNHCFGSEITISIGK